MRMVTLPAFTDNYIFVLEDDGDTAAVVDPGDAEPVLDRLARTGRRLTAILNTHHHADHAGGNRALLARFPGVPVYGGASDRGRIPGQTVFVGEDPQQRMLRGMIKPDQLPEAPEQSEPKDELRPHSSEN